MLHCVSYRIICVSGITGKVVIDFKCDRIMDYAIWYLPENGDTYEEHMVVPMTLAFANATKCTPWLVQIYILCIRCITIPEDLFFPTTQHNTIISVILESQEWLVADHKRKTWRNL